MQKYGKKTLITIFLFIILSCVWLYRESFHAYFFQDDWFSLSISRNSSIAGIFRFFLPRTDVIYYRPLGMQIPYFLISSLFGLNSYAFHTIIFISHIINIILVFFLIRLLILRDDYALLSSFFYATSTIHYIPFFWFATYAFIIGPTFFFLAFILYVLYLKKNINRYFIYSLVIFFIGMFTNEMIFILPFILLVYSFISNCNYKKYISLFWFVIIDILIFGVRYILFPPPTSGMYELEIGRSMITNLKGYILWSFNWPEEMKAQLIRFFTFNPKFINDFYSYFWIFIISIVINLMVFYIIPIIILFLKKRFAIFKKVIFGIAWFILGLTSVLFFPKHSFSYYLPISFVGLLYIYVTLHTEVIKVSSVFRRLNTFFIILLIVNWLIAGTATVKFNSQVHWAPRRAKLSRDLVSQALIRSTVKSSGMDIIIDPSSENIHALNNQDAFKVIFGLDTNTIYTKDVKAY